MKRRTAPWVRKAEDDREGTRTLVAKKPALRDLVCFHCQQAAEKYLKAMLHELGAPVPKTHELAVLLDLLLPHDATLAALRRPLMSLSRYAVMYRYPGSRATTRRMQAALRHMERVHAEIRTRLGLAP